MTSTLNPSIDTLMAANAADTKYGTGTYLAVGERNDGTGLVRRTLIKFDFVAAGIPANAVVDAVTLRLYCITDYADNAHTFRVYRTKRAWVETEATWNRFTPARVGNTA